MWRKMKDKQLCVQYNSLYNRIPVFVGTDKAALLLTETPEFIKASKSFQVNNNLIIKKML